MFIRCFSLVLVTFVFLFSSWSDTFSWGDTGHRIVAKIAEGRLTPEAVRGIAQITGNESLPRAATWADEVKSDPDREHFAPTELWHFADISEGQTYLSMPKNPRGDVVQAIERMSEVLNNPASTKAAKIEALRFFVHFVGDVHQPMHVGNSKDNGGNLCLVKWGYEMSNLHRVWDSQIINDTRLSYTEYVDFINHPSGDDAEKWQKSSPVDWAEESHSILENAYPSVSVNGAKLPGRPYCKAKPEENIPEALIPVLKFEYSYKFRPILEHRMLQAGVRLAGLLNEIFK